MSKQKIFFPNLDGLRFIAFFMVYLYHGFGEAFKFSPRFSSVKINVLGGMGVSVFFVLSGFLITYLILSEIISDGKLNVKAFYIRRALRIWPLYYLVVVVIFLIFPLVKQFFHVWHDSSSRPIYFFTFLSNFDVINTQKNFSGNDYLAANDTWSVSVEEQFYFLWPLFFALLPKRWYPVVLFCVLGTSVIFRFFHRKDGFVMYFHSLSVCGDLAIGGIAAYYSLFSNSFKRFFAEMSKPLQMLCFGVLIAGLLSGYFFPEMRFHEMGGRLWFILASAFFILHQNFCNYPILSLSKIKYISFWGKRTYGLYLLHPFALLFIEWLFSFFEMNTQSVQHVLLCGTLGFAVSLLLSYLSYRYYENYFLKQKEKFRSHGSWHTKHSHLS